MASLQETSSQQVLIVTLVLLPTYYVIKVDENTIKAATTLGNALNGTAFDLTVDGTTSPPNITGVGLTSK